jgi:hypothetical protein
MAGSGGSAASGI